MADYNPDLKYDPASTDPDHAKKVLNKFFSDEKNIIVENGGTLVVDETCTVEIEYDAATTAELAAAPGTDLFQGVMAVKDG